MRVTAIVIAMVSLTLPVFANDIHKVAGTVSTYICAYRNGYYSSANDAMDAANSDLIKLGYTYKQISKLMLEAVPIIENMTTAAFCD